MAPSLPRRGPGFQLRILMRVCSSKRFPRFELVVDVERHHGKAGLTIARDDGL